jgi:hypothetical protein
MTAQCVAWRARRQGLLPVPWIGLASAERQIDSCAGWEQLATDHHKALLTGSVVWRGLPYAHTHGLFWHDRMCGPQEGRHDQ